MKQETANLQDSHLIVLTKNDTDHKNGYNVSGGDQVGFKRNGSYAPGYAKIRDVVKTHCTLSFNDPRYTGYTPHCVKCGIASFADDCRTVHKDAVDTALYGLDYYSWRAQHKRCAYCRP